MFFSRAKTRTNMTTSTDCLTSIMSTRTNITITPITTSMSMAIITTTDMTTTTLTTTDMTTKTLTLTDEDCDRMAQIGNGPNDCEIFHAVHPRTLRP